MGVQDRDWYWEDYDKHIDAQKSKKTAGINNPSQSIWNKHISPLIMLLIPIILLGLLFAWMFFSWT